MDCVWSNRPSFKLQFSQKVKFEQSSNWIGEGLKRTFQTFIRHSTNLHPASNWLKSNLRMRWRYVFTASCSMADVWLWPHLIEKKISGDRCWQLVWQVLQDTFFVGNWIPNRLYGNFPTGHTTMDFLVANWSHHGHTCHQFFWSAYFWQHIACHNDV